MGCVNTCTPSSLIETLRSSRGTATSPSTECSVPSEHADLQWAPMFAFVDPYSTTPLAWETLGKLAAFKHGRKYKVELWLLFYGSAIPRLAGLKDSAQEASISRFFGSNEWVDIAKARNLGALNAEQARYEYTNLMRWRLEKVLRYKHTHTLEVKNTSGAYLYNLIFATDNPTGDKIMGDIYRAALARNEKMRLEAAEIRREQRSGQAGMFGLDLVEGPAIDSDLAYVHEPPTPPYGAKASDDNG